MRRHTKSQKGFTLIEILVISPIVILAIGAFLTVIISVTGEVLASRGSNALAYNVQDAMNRIEQDVKLSSAFLAKNNITITIPQGSDDGTADFTNVGGANGPVLILSEPVTNANPLTLGTKVVYLSNMPNGCGGSQEQNNVVMTMNVIYFVKNNTLYRRTVMPPSYNTIGCSTPWQRPSCTTPSGFCVTNDVKLVDGVSAGSFFVQYFTSANSTIPNSVASDTASSVDARNAALFSTPTVAVSVNASQTVAGRTLDRSATLRATRLETNATVVAPAPTQSLMTSAPTKLTTTSDSTSQVTVNWTAPAGVPTSYTLQWSRQSNFASPTTISGITQTTRAITGLSSATGYFVRVSATNSFGTTGYSTTAYGPTTGTNSWASCTKLTMVADWNNDGKNDMMCWLSNGDVEMHLGKGDGTVGPRILVTNIGTTVRNFFGVGILPSGTKTSLFWVNTNAYAYVITSDGSWGVTGSPTLSASTATPSWGTAGTSVFGVPYFWSSGAVGIVVKSDALFMWTLNSSGVASYVSTFGSGWDSSFPGDSVVGIGRFSPDSVGDIVGITAAGSFNTYNGLGTGTTASGVAQGAGWTGQRAIGGGFDMNGDGKADFLRLVTTGNILYFYSNNGATYVNSPSVLN
ncbi:MAG: hypothetical protein JWM52_279 [Candidatus Saccharibacteria bacterium]|nr:hypothetical protein [Candidatus Saccharibacteria bacterium]